jgi:D-glycero-D-manno-heptose 1,7-bisphosphate phosphatase
VDERVRAGGGRIDGYYYCPHHPEAEIEKYRKDCDCRKPAPGMLRQAAADLDLDLPRSFAVGDKWTDVQAGVAAGARGILVRTGYGRTSEGAPTRPIEPVTIADDLIAATAWILRNEDPTREPRLPAVAQSAEAGVPSPEPRGDR